MAASTIAAMPTTHDRYPYSPITGRPAWEWPNGTRLAVYVAVDVECLPASRDYGNRVGVWRLLELLDDLRLPAAALAGAGIYEHAPQIMAAFRQREDEIVGCGRSASEQSGELPEGEVRKLIDAATRTIARHEGRPPEGWVGAAGAGTPDVVQEIGYGYVMDWGHDDQPVWLKTRGGRILSVPYSPATEAQHVEGLSPTEQSEILVDTFDEMLYQSRHQALVCCLSLQPSLAGLPAHLRALRRALVHIAENRERGWIARPGEIARHAASLRPGTIV